MNDIVKDAEFSSLFPRTSFNRREFLTASLGTGFALAVQPVMAQSVIETSSEGLLVGTVSVPVAEGTVQVYRAQPAKTSAKPLPVILVISEIFGVHAHIADVCRRLAKLGYLALAPDLFARQGDVAKLSNMAEIQQVIAQVPDAQVKTDLDAVVAWANAHGGDKQRLGITGFCWGGRITWLYSAYNPAVRAGVAWYGRLRGNVTANTPRYPLDLADSLNGPVLGLYGGQDQGIPLADVESMQSKLKAAGGQSQIVVYPDAPHAFHADYRPSYREAAARDGWQRLQDWFKQHGV